jgi:uncharacterized membrane protein
MTGLPLIPLVGLALLFFASPLIVLILILVLLNMRGRVRRLEARLAQLEQRADATPAPRGAEPRASAVEEIRPITSAEPADTTGREEAAAEGATMPLAAATAAPSTPSPGAAASEPAVEAPPTAPAASWPPARAEVGQWEGRLGGTWLSRVGAILFVLGVGFFLKHAFDQDWIGPKGRVLAGLGAGIAMLAGGVRLARGTTYRVPAQSLVAVGIGVLYLSIYAAQAFYELVAAPAAFVAMAIVTAAGVATALRLDSLALAVLATLGGLLTPIILSTDTDAAATLFTYLVILDLGVLLVAYRRGWSGVAVLAFVGTQVLYWSWLERWYETERIPTAFGWATVFFLAFAVWALVGSSRERPTAVLRLGRALVVLAAPTLYFIAVRRILHDPSGRRLAGLALALAAGYYVAARVAARSEQGGPRAAVLHRALALGFLAAAPAVTLGPHNLVIVWSVVALILLIGGFTVDAPRLRAGALVIGALAWGRWFAAIGENTGRAGTFLLAHPALPATVAIVVTAILGALAYRARERGTVPLARGERFVRPILLLIAIGSAALLLTAELDQYRTLAIPPPYVPIVKSVVWMLVSMALLALARADGTRILFGVATVLLLALGAEALGGVERWGRIQPSLRPAVSNPRFLAGCLLVVLAWLYGQVAAALPYLSERARRWLGTLGSIGAAALLLWNLSVEVVLMPLPETRFEPAKLRTATLSVLWAIYAFTAMAWGLWRNDPALRVGAILLFSVTVLKVLVVDLADLDALYRILSVLVLGATLLIASFLYARSRRHPGATG